MELSERAEAREMVAATGMAFEAARARVRRARAMGLSWRDAEDRRKQPCEICGRKGKLVFDHSHSHLGARGWLCYACNHGLGCFQDNPIVLIKAIAYLEANARTLY